MDFRVGKNNVIWLVAKGFLAIFFFLFFLYPILSILFIAIPINKINEIDFFGLIFSNQRLIWNSFFQASISTFFAVLIGIPFAFIIARRQFPGKKIIKALSLIPFVFPSILVVISFVIIYGNNGWINFFLKEFLFFESHIQFLYGFSGIILAHTFYNFPLVARFVSGSWEKLDYSMKETAKTLSASPFQIFFRVTLPQLMPSILASASIVFIYTFMSFAIVLSLGGISFTTLEVEIFRQISRNLDFSTGAILAIIQYLILAIFVLVFLIFSKKFKIKEKLFLEKPKKLSFKTFRGIMEIAFFSIAIIFIILPFFSLIVFAFFNSGEFSLRAFEKIFIPVSAKLIETSPLNSIFLSLFFGITASIIATFIGLIAAIKHSRISFIELFLSSSIAISVITLGFGYFLSYGSGIFWVIIVGHAVLAFPFSYRILKNALDKIDLESIDSARTLGANKLQVFKLVQFPRIKNSLLTALSFSFAISLGELGLVLVLYDGIFATMPVYIYRLLSTFDLASATAMGLILVFISFISFYLIEHYSKDTAVF